jgi:hypothetical protein
MFARATRVLAGVLALLVFSLHAAATDSDRDFSGVWVLDEQHSDFRALPAAPGALLTVTQEGSTLRWAESDKDGKSAGAWIYHTDANVSKYRIREAGMSSQSKWEGLALLVNTIVTGPQNYVVMDRWRLSRDHSVLTIRRQIQRGGAETEAVLVYRNQHASAGGGEKPSSAPPALVPPAVAPPDAVPPAVHRPTQPPSEIVVPAGTKVPLALVNSLSTKHSGVGDRVYLETVFPVTIDGHIVIPRGSYVTGTVTEAKRPGRVKGRGEMFLRFDSLTLPNGTTRDFRARLGGADADVGQVDREEGKVRGEGNKGHDARTVGETTAAGTSVGAIAGSAAGHAGMGAGIGAAAGVAAGLAAVLLSRGPDLVLPKGTSFEMVLDRSLRFKPTDVGF